MKIYTTAKINLAYDSFYYPSNIFLNLNHIIFQNLNHAEAKQLSCAVYTVLMLSLYPAGAGVFFLLVQQSLLQTALVDHKWMVFTLQPHKVAVESQDYFFLVCWKCYSDRAHYACILCHHSLSYAPL